MVPKTAEAVDRVYRADWGRIVATLIRQIGDFDLAEEVAQDAFVAALDQWASTGIPISRGPGSFRRRGTGPSIASGARRGWTGSSVKSWLPRRWRPASSDRPNPATTTADIPDDRLRLIFTCCHPALPQDARVALTLRTLCGLETDEIARAFLVSPRRWRSGSSARSTRSETRGFRTRFPRPPTCPSGSTRS